MRLRQFVPRLDLIVIRTLLDAVEDDLRVPNRRHIIIQGYKSANYYVVEHGFAMRYHLLHDGRRQVFSIVVPGDIIGLAATSFDVSPTSVCSLSDMKIQRFHMTKFREICSCSPPLSIAMMCYLVHELGLYYDRLTEIGRQSPVERVAHFLLRFHSRLQAAGHATEDGFDMPLSQEIIGDLLGLSAPHVNRMLHRLRSEGLITMHRRRIELQDVEGLRRLGEFAPMASLPIAAAG
jgi:CRP-like cAMP-binding protein